MSTSKKPGAIIIEGHIQGLSNTRSLGEAGIPVYVVDKTRCIAQHSKYCKEFFRCPDFIKDEFADFLIALAKKKDIKGWVLIPSNDHAVYILSKHKKRLEEYFKLITPGLEIIDNIYDKVRLIEIAKKLDVPVPVTQIFHSADDPISRALKFPVLTKGRNGLSFYKAVGKKAFIAYNETELRAQLKIIGNIMGVSESLTQELIPYDGRNKTISFTAFCDKGKIKAHWTGVKLREHPLQFGTATFAKNTTVTECHHQSEKLLTALNYTGVCEVEYLSDPRTGEYKLIEINPRTWLWVGLAKTSGVDYPKMIYDYVNGDNLDYTLDDDDNTHYWRNPLTDFVYSALAILKLKLNPFKYFVSLFYKKMVNPLFIKGDMKPGFFYILNLFHYVAKR
jgi:D-aspartate ligase